MHNCVNFMSQIKLLKKMVYNNKREQATKLDKVMFKIYK